MRRFQAAPRGLAGVGAVLAAAFVADCSAQTPDGRPRLEVAESDGCADIFVFGVDSERLEFLTVHADAEALGLERGRERSFSLDAPPAGHLEVALDVYEEPPIAPQYCNDIIGWDRPTARWTGIGGRVTIALTDRNEATDRAGGEAGPWYRATVVLEDLTLEDAEGRRVTADGPIRLDADVGWLPG